MYAIRSYYADFTLKYGRQSLRAELPDGTLLTCRAVGAPQNPAEVIRGALDAPLGTPRLGEIVRPGESSYNFV